jgi:hypothetical protein
MNQNVSAYEGRAALSYLRHLAEPNEDLAKP